MEQTLTKRSSLVGNQLVGWMAASLVLLLIGGWLTSLGLGTWYEELRFPPFQPPAWIFTPAWIVILTLLAVATSNICKSHEPHHARWQSAALLLYGVQFALNAGWSLLFFSLKRPDVAFWEIVILDVVLLLMILVYGKISRLAGWLLVPYFCWLLFATAINAWIAVHNGPFTS